MKKTTNQTISIVFLICLTISGPFFFTYIASVGNDITESISIENIKNSAYHTYYDERVFHADAGQTRDIRFVIPDSYDPSVPTPVVLACHGLFGSYDSYYSSSKCYEMADYGGAIVVVPNGINGMFGFNGWLWNDPSPDNIDVMFLKWIIEYTDFSTIGPYSGGLNVDRSKLYIGGFSQGGTINTCVGAAGGDQIFAAFYHIAGGKQFSSPIGAERKFPAFVIVSDDDGVMGGSSETLRQAYVDEGHPFYYELTSDYGHSDHRTYPNFNQKLWNWLSQYSLDVGSLPDLEAEFIASDTSIVEGDSISFTFTGKVTNGPATFLWSFGDGTTSEEENPSHKYSSQGTYTVSLTVTDDNGDTDSITKDNYIQVSSSSGFPITPGLMIVMISAFAGITIVLDVKIKRNKSS